MRALQRAEQTAEQVSQLSKTYRHTKDVRRRTRAQMVLLAWEQHLTAPCIAGIVHEDAGTVRRWLKRYLVWGREGLRDRPRSGAPAKATKAYQEQLLAAVRGRPRSQGQSYSMWTLQRLADYMAEQTGISVSTETIRRLLALHESVFSQPQHTVSSPDPAYVQKKKTNYGIGAVNYFTGETVVHFQPHKRRQEMAQLLAALVEKHPTGTIYVAWDNANTHEDEEVDAVVQAAAGRLILLYLPTYSPWLNPIEMRLPTFSPRSHSL